MQERLQAWKEALWIFLLSRFSLLLITYITISRFAIHKNPPRECLYDPVYCLLAWDKWDVSHYATIASAGYERFPYLPAFFPLYPLITSPFAALGGSSRAAAVIAGMLITNLCFLLALALLYRLVSQDFSPAIARSALFLMAFGPYSLFFFAGYPEALFMLVSLAFFLFLRRGRTTDWWLAGLCGFLATLTRSAGIALIIPFLIVVFQRFWPLHRQIWKHWRPLLHATLPMALIPLAVLVYMLYLNITTGDPLAFNTQQVGVWQRRLNFPWVGIYNTLHILLNGGQFERNLIDLLFVLIPIVALIIGWKKLPLHYNMYAVFMLFFALSYPYKGFAPLFATPRYILVIFPLFILFAHWSEHARLKNLFFAVSLTLFVINTILFLTDQVVA